MTTLPFSRVAVVNRGEAAVRFMRAARTWSRQHDRHLSVVAFYTTADAGAPFVRMASAAVDLGEPLAPGPDGNPRSPYVDVERVLDLAQDAGCDAVWPGWGFVSESPEFARRCAERGLTLIGPPAEAMRLLGDKIASKRLAEEHRVPVAPWSGGPVADAAEARVHAERIGFPAVLKAAAGGGGRGIRVVREAGALESAFASAAAEAAAAFGDASLFVESFVASARHVEVQVLADRHGGVWTLGTRDCSLQRRNQKVIEEAPAPLAPAVEKSLCASALRLARACGYVSAGTVEFLLLDDGETFYFLEMNTRLQVEHTVTEEIYGVDLVGAQIDIAMGEALPADGPPAPRGAAVQARLNAEDPDDGFAPRAGRLVRFSPPEGPGVRVDSGYSRGAVIPSAFDSNIAKIIAWGRDRRQALARLQTALRDTIVAIDSGLTNRSLLLELVAGGEFRSGPTTTRWLDAYLGRRPPSARRPRLELALAAAAIGDHVRTRNGHLANFLDEAQRGMPRGVPEPGPSQIAYRLDGSPISVSVATLAPNRYRVGCGAWNAVLGAWATGERTTILELDGFRSSVIRIATATDVYVDVEGTAHRFQRASDGKVRAALPAAVSQIHVETGQRIEAADRLITLEVMKMEMTVEAPLAGTVLSIEVKPAGRVAAGDLLVEIAPEASADATAGAPATAVSLPERREPTLDPLEVLRIHLMGFDVEAEEANAAAKALKSGTPSRGRLLRLLRAYVVQEQLFRSGPFDDARNEAGESSLGQLTWYLHHRHLDASRLSARYIRRLQRFLDLHGIAGAERGPRIEHAVMRLLQARASQRRIDGHMLAVLQALARSSPDAETEMETRVARVIFEKLANDALERRLWLLASAAWDLIYRWYDLPAHRREIERLAARAGAALRALGAPDARPTDRFQARDRLLAVPVSVLVGAIAGTDRESRDAQQALLRVLLQRLYDSADQEPVAAGPIAARRLWTARRHPVTGALVSAPSLLGELSQELTEGTETDVFLAFVPEPGTLAAAAANSGCPRVTFVWARPGDADGPVQARTFRRVAGRCREDRLLRDVHPARPVAREIARLSNFELERLPAPGGLFAARATAPGDQRLVVIGEVERFAAEVEEHALGQAPTDYFVRVPEFEKVYLDAVQVLRRELQRPDGKAPVWNRITLIIRPVVKLSPAQIKALAGRLAPSTLDLSLDRVMILGRFDFGGLHSAREAAIEWHTPVALGLRVRRTIPRHRPIPVLSTYEQRMMVARRRRLFYPYEIIRWLTSRDGDSATLGGRFEELELDDAGSRLVPVDRPLGENRANLVAGLITNWSERFPEGLKRVLLIGDPTRTMGSLGEPECRRIVAALDLADEQALPVEWVALSAGAKISFDSGTENLDWTAAVLRRIIEFTEGGGVIHVIVDGGCVGAQSYWNAEATMLMHCRGTLIMTPRGYMVLTGKRALEYAGSVAAASNEAIGGLDVMEPNGQAQYTAGDLHGAYELLFRHYELTYVVPGEGYTRPVAPPEPIDRDITGEGYEGAGGFERLGEIFTETTNPGRKKPFAIRRVMAAVLDRGIEPLERWARLEGGETAVVFHGQLGGQPVCMVGIESMPVKRKGAHPVDGPESWMSGTLFPGSSRKIARAISAASGIVPVVVLANLSGFDGSPESLRHRQLEYGAEIGRAVVNFQGPIVFCVIGRYHGGAYVVFSRSLSAGLDALALEGSFASVIGGAPAAAVVFPRLVEKRTLSDERVLAAREALEAAPADQRTASRERFEELYRTVEAEQQARVASEFDAVHSVERAREVGSLSAIVAATELRPALCERLRAGVARYRAERGLPAPHRVPETSENSTPARRLSQGERA